MSHHSDNSDFLMDLVEPLSLLASDGLKQREEAEVEYGQDYEAINC